MFGPLGRVVVVCVRVSHHVALYSTSEFLGFPSHSLFLLSSTALSLSFSLSYSLQQKMGSAQSYIMSPEGALTALVMAGAIGLGYTQLGGPAAQPPGTGATPGVNGKKDAAETGATPPTKKGKKKSSKAGVGEVSETGSATKSQEPQVMEKVIPGQFDSVPVSATPQPPATKKSKKKKGKAAVARSPSEPPSEPASAPVSSAIDYLSESSIKEAGKKRKKQQLQGGQQPPPPMPSSSAVTSTPASQLTRPLQQSTTSIDTDGSWTRVGRGKGKSAGGADYSAAPTSTTTSDAGMTTTSPTADSSPVTGLSTAATLDEDRGGEEASFLLNVNERERNSGDANRRTLAEKLLPKPRKTGVDELSFPRSFFRFQLCRLRRPTCILMTIILRFSLCFPFTSHRILMDAILTQPFFQHARNLGLSKFGTCHTRPTASQREACYRVLLGRLRGCRRT